MIILLAFRETGLDETGIEASLARIPLLAYMLLALGYYFFVLEAWRDPNAG